MRVYEVGSVKADKLREFTAELIQKLDELDEVDYFGDEGWRAMLMGMGSEDGED